MAGAGRAAWTQCRSGHGAAYTVEIRDTLQSTVTRPGEADYILNCDTNILHVLKKPSDNVVIGGYLL